MQKGIRELQVMKVRCRFAFWIGGGQGQKKGKMEEYAKEV